MNYELNMLDNSAGIKYIDDLDSWTLEEAQEQILVRHSLINNMVGSLYPAILSDDIEKIRESIKSRLDKK